MIFIFKTLPKTPLVVWICEVKYIHSFFFLFCQKPFRESLHSDWQKNRHGRFNSPFPLKLYAANGISCLQGVWNVFTFSFSFPFVCPSLTRWGGTSSNSTAHYRLCSTRTRLWLLKGVKVWKTAINQVKYGRIMTREETGRGQWKMGVCL